MVKSSSRSQIKRLVSDLQELNECPRITQEYLEALRTLDEDKLSFFAQFGSSARHRVLNVSYYRHGLRFGFQSMELCRYEWLAKPEWSNYEEIKLDVDKKITGNEIRLGSGPNGKWCYGLSMAYGSSSGSSWPLSVFSTPYPSREVALSEACLRMKKSMTDSISHASNHNSNYNIPFMNKVIGKIEELEVLPKLSEQLLLF